MTPPAPETPRRLLSLRHPPDAVAEKARVIYETVLRDSPRVRQGDFRAIAPADLALLFDLYDAQFLEGLLRQLLRAGGAPLSFVLSPRLTRSAALTKRYTARAGGSPPARYEIAVSSTLLYQTFKDVHRTVRVNGVVCRDRLEALQRVFEHELVHLVELLVRGRSSCAAQGFKALAWNYFAHTETSHDLVTQDERARAQFDLHPGDRVSFTFEGARRVGVLNRITRRATVLVESPEGQHYSDGRRYQKFYVPVDMLQKVGGPGGEEAPPP
jgi:hypothetical protein